MASLAQAVQQRKDALGLWRHVGHPGEVKEKRVPPALPVKQILIL